MGERENRGKRKRGKGEKEGKTRRSLKKGGLAFTPWREADRNEPTILVKNRM
jgi:hypothetical protein